MVARKDARINSPQKPLMRRKSLEMFGIDGFFKRYKNGSRARGFGVEDIRTFMWLIREVVSDGVHVGSTPTHFKRIFRLSA